MYEGWRVCMAKGQPRSPGMHLDRHSVAFFDSMHTLFLIYMVRLPPVLIMAFVSFWFWYMHTEELVYRSVTILW